MKIGVLALQGAVREHIRAVENCGARAVPIKYSQELDEIDGLIIPGGESTTIGKLMVANSLLDLIKTKGLEGIPIFGTCAGLIMLAKETVEGGQPLLGLMDIVARRNAFGRQVDSFETDISIEKLGERPFRAVFIRAPWIEVVSPKVKVLAEHEGKAIMAWQDNYLACAFHPELTDDLRVHRYFLEMAKRVESRAIRDESW